MSPADRFRRSSRFLSLVLRHDPGRIGMVLDPQGWVEVELLLEACGNAGHPMSRASLDELVAGNDKQRFAFSEDGRRIRASQGHSIEIDLGLEPLDPPTRLYHGTATRFLEGILAEGLYRRSRQQVHLSADEETARKVGARHGKPVILRIDAAAMHAAGHLFYRSANGVWLVDAVPPQFLTR